MKTLSRMSAYALHPDERAAAAAKHYVEYPQIAAAAAAAAGPLELHLEGAAAETYRPRGAGWRAVARGAAPALVARAAREDEALRATGGGGGSGGDLQRRQQQQRSWMWWVRPGEPHPVYGEDDPLSADEAKALPVEELVQVRSGLI